MSKSWLSFILMVIATLLLLFWKMIGINILHILSLTYLALMHALHPFILDHSVRQIIVVLLTSVLLGLIPAFIYWIFKRQWSYDYMTSVWCIWIAIITMIIIKQGYRA